MQYTSVPQWHTCYYPIPNQSFNQQHIRYPLNRFITTTTTSLRTTTTTNNNVFTTTHYVTTTNTKNHNNQETNPENTQITRSLVDSCSVSQPRKPDLEEFEETDRVGDLGFFPGMSWVEFKAALGQRINFEGIVSSVGVLARDRHLAIPNLGVTDIRFIDWGELKRRGFQGIVFDKDNTLTIPYNLRLCEPLGESFGQCRSLFGDNVAVFSNSAGLHEYDPDGRKAKALERAIGIKVIKHRVKKPAGTAEDIERHFGCDSSKLIMVGDRPFTDIVYGNRNGFLTILTKPLSVEEEPFIVKQMRILEVALVNYWCRKGLKATNHRLLPQPKQCVKEQPW